MGKLARAEYNLLVKDTYLYIFINLNLLWLQIPFVGFAPVRTSEHMAAAGIFALLQAIAFLKYLQNFLTKSEFKSFFLLVGVAAAGIGFVVMVGLTWAGVVAPWSGRFYSLWDTGM